MQEKYLRIIFKKGINLDGYAIFATHIRNGHSPNVALGEIIELASQRPFLPHKSMFIRHRYGVAVGRRINNIEMCHF